MGMPRPPAEILAFAFLFVAFPLVGAANAQSPDSRHSSRHSILTGGDFLKMQIPSGQQAVWFWGVLDGMMAESLEIGSEPRQSDALKERSASEFNSTWISKCTQRHGIDQLFIAFQKKVESDPDMWNVPAVSIARSVILSLCNAPESPTETDASEERPE